MTTIKQNFTALGPGFDSALDVLRSRLSVHDVKDDEWKKIRSVRVIEDNLEGQDCTLDRKNDYVLRIAMAQGDVIKDIRKQLEIKQTKTPQYKWYLDEKEQDKKTKLKTEPLDQEEKKSQASLKVLSELLDRAYNRRTTLTSWVLYLVFKSFGFQNDNFEPVSNILKEDDNFAKVFTQYRKKLTENNRADADAYLKTIFTEEKEEDKNKKQNLVKTASFLIESYNKLNIGFAKWFPKIFCIQNITMPFLKWVFPKIKLFDFMVTLNPWLYEVSENLGNYIGEIREIQKIEKETNKEKVISEINLTPLNSEELSLQNIIKHINNGLDRIFGKGSTLSSMIINKILEHTPYGGYKAFAEQFTHDDFVKQLHKGLNRKAPDGEFKDSYIKSFGAKVIWGITSFARSIPAEKIKQFSNIFGLIFVPLNLAMPLLAKVFNKGIMGFVVHSLLKVFPIANELIFDIAANFRKELLDIQKETSDKSVANLFSQIDPQATYEVFISRMKDLYKLFKGKFSIGTVTS